MSTRINPIDAALRDIRKRYGEGAVTTASQLLQTRKQRVVPTGCLPIDRLFDGGLPTGIPIALYGNAGSGKTTLANAAVAQILRDDPQAIAIFIQTEGDIPYRAWEMFGIDPTDRVLVFHQSQYGERTLDAVFTFLERVKPSVDEGELNIGALVLDSVSGLLPYQDLTQIEAKGSEVQPVATHARLVSQFLRRFGGSGKFAGPLSIIISQVREQVSQMPLPKQMTGGHALRHWCKVHLELTTSQGRKVTRGDLKGLESLPGLEFLAELDEAEIVGHVVDVQLLRNSTQFGLPRGRCQYRVIYGYGFDNFTPVMDAAVRYGLVQQRGAYYEYANIRQAGRTQMIGRLVSEGLWDELYRKVSELLFRQRAVLSEPEPSSEREPVELDELPPLLKRAVESGELEL